MVRQQQLARRVECHRRTQHTRSATSRRRYVPIFISCHISAALSGFAAAPPVLPVRPMVVQLTADESDELHAGDKGRRAQVRSLCVAQPRPCSRVSAAGPPRAPATRRGAASRCCPPSRRRHRRHRGRLRHTPPPSRRRPSHHAPSLRPLLVESRYAWRAPASAPRARGPPRKPQRQPTARRRPRAGVRIASDSERVPRSAGSAGCIVCLCSCSGVGRARATDKSRAVDLCCGYGQRYYPAVG
jgi:hypothetical protein